MQHITARGARLRLGDALRPARVVPTWARIGDDIYLLYTAALIPVVLLVALIAQRPGELWLALLLGALAFAGQAILGVVGRRRRHSGRVAWQIVRLVPPLLFVAIASRSIGGPSLPLIAL
jgi:lipopolysaccharide export LptBFGC system permease protein LptF